MKLLLIVLCGLCFGDNYLVEPYGITQLMDTSPEEVPFQALVHATGMCGGILLSEYYVVTPAYCVDGSWSATVYLGYRGNPYVEEYDSEPNTQVLYSNNILMHEDFEKLDEHYLNNIAMIKLPTPASLSNSVKLGKIISREEAQLLEGRDAEISGWLITLQDTLKRGTVTIRTQDTCSYLFEYQFFKSQEFCVSWSSETHLNLLGNAVQVDNKIIGFQTNTPQCAVASLGCSEHDLVLNFVPFLNWMAKKMKIPIEQFTSGSSQKANSNIDLTKIKQYDSEMASLNRKIENAIAKVEKIEKGQNVVGSLHNAQIANMQTEFNSSRATTEQNVINLKEELNSVRTQISNGLIAQKGLNDLETKVNDLSANVQNKINGKLNNVVQQNENLANEIKNNQINENQHCLDYKKETTNLHDKLSSIDDRELKYHHAVDDQFNYINTTIEKVSNSQNKLYIELENIRTELRTHISKPKEIPTELQEKLKEIIDTIEKNTLKDKLHFDEIEKVFGEQRNDMDIHVIKELKDIRSVWAEIKTLNGKIKQMEVDLYAVPESN